MHVQHLGRSGKAFVHFRAVLHRARSLADVDIAVNSDILLGKMVVMSHKLKLCDLREICRIIPYHPAGKSPDGLLF